jgi:hypothetical protein
MTNPINLEPATVAERDMLRLCTQAAEARVVELEAAADTYGPQGMWRFWNDKALSLAEKLTAADASLALVTAGRDTLSRRLDRADDRVAKLVEAANNLKLEWAIHPDDGLTYLVVNAGNADWVSFRAALAALEAGK